MRIKVVFATETGNAEDLAEDTVKFLNDIGISTEEAINLYGADASLFENTDVLLAIVSTWGDGEPPTDAEDFHEFLLESDSLGLSHLNFAVLALGDSGYDLFCQYGKDLDTELERHGAQRILERLECDVDYEDHFEGWIRSVTARLATLRLNAVAT